MKLRNKKTGDAVYVDFQIPLCNNDKVLGSYSVTSLKELNESFEDYTPQEPRIEDERIRNTLRAWAEVNGIEEVGVVQQREITTFCDDNTDITFYGNLPGLIDGAEYTIAELCGESDS